VAERIALRPPTSTFCRSRALVPAATSVGITSLSYELRSMGPRFLEATKLGNELDGPEFERRLGAFLQAYRRTLPIEQVARNSRHQGPSSEDSQRGQVAPG
jgi:hypothetical protein